MLFRSSTASQGNRLLWVEQVAVPDYLAGNVSEMAEVFARIKQIAGQEHVDPLQTEIGSMVYAVKPGDGSAREQAASCQRVIGGLANIAEEYATKRYRSNVINWGMLPLQMAEAPTFEVGDYIYIPGIKAALDNPGTTFKGYVIHEDAPVTEITLYMESLTAEERREEGECMTGVRQCQRQC